MPDKPPTMTQRVTSLEDKLARETERSDSHEKMLTDPNASSGLVITRAGMARAHERITELNNVLNGRIDVMQQAIEAMQRGRKSFISTLRDAGVTDEQIRETLIILGNGDGEVDLTDDELFTEMFTAFMTHKHETNVRLNAIDGGQAPGPDDNIHALNARINAVATTLGETRRELFRRDSNDSLNPLGWVAAVVLGVLAGVVWALVDWTETLGIQVGTQTGTAELDYSVLNSGWFPFVVGAGVFCLVAVIASFFPRGSNTTETEERAPHHQQATDDGATPDQPTIAMTQVAAVEPEPDVPEFMRQDETTPTPVVQVPPRLTREELDALSDDAIDRLRAFYLQFYPLTTIEGNEREMQINTILELEERFHNDHVVAADQREEVST